MRFNQKELAYIASRTDQAFDKEGVLLIKERDGYFWQRNEVYSERWFRLKGNILFYFKTKEKNSEPVGAVVLERCKVLQDPSKQFAFTIVFEEDDSQQYHLCGKNAEDSEEWIDKIKNSSYESLRNKLSSLRRQLMEITGEDPLPDFHPLAIQEPLKPGISQYSSSSSVDVDETPFLEMCIACNGLTSPVEGRLPNAFVEIRTMTPPSTSWSKHAQTEIIEQKSDPYFLTTVVFPSGSSMSCVTRLKLAVFDVRDREKEEMSLLGQAMCTIKDILSSPDNKHVLSLTPLDSPQHCGTIILLGWKVEPVRQRLLSEEEDAGLESRRNSGKSMVMVEQVLKRSYRFPTQSVHKVLKVVEMMAESSLSFKIPIQLLKIYIAEERQKILELDHLGDLNRDWETVRQEVIDNHFKLMCIYQGNLQELLHLRGSTFKASRNRGEKKLEFVPINLHIQRMRVTIEDESSVYDVITAGAPAAHTLKFSQGGLQRLMISLRKAQHHGGGGSENKSYVVQQARANLERLKVTISSLCDKLKVAVNTSNPNQLLETMSTLSDKCNHLLKFRKTALVTESLGLLETAVPQTRDEDEPDAEWYWNVSAFRTASSSKCQDLSKLVEQSLLMLQGHVEGMLQGVQPPKEKSWNETILLEAHDFSRATVALVKEVHLGLIFLQLKEEGKHSALVHTIRRRKDVVFSQTLTTLVAGFVCKLHSCISNKIYLRQLVEIGFLAQFESLLSTNGDEMGMLEDMSVGVAAMTNVKFKIVRCDKDDEIPALSGSRSYIQVSVPFPSQCFQLLPKEIQRGRLVKVIPVLFTQGINEHATLAERFGDTTLQERINGDNYSILNFYYQQFIEKFPEAVPLSENGDSVLTTLMNNLKTNVEAKKNKNVDIFLISEELCWRMNGCRFVSCKSAKDRTAMAVTLEQCLWLRREHDMDPEFFQQALDAMRSEGTRRENTFKNAGIRKYAFNSLQVLALPKQYRPPVGTWGKNVQT